MTEHHVPTGVRPETLPIVFLASDGSEELAMCATRVGVTEYVLTGTN